MEPLRTPEVSVGTPGDQQTQQIQQQPPSQHLTPEAIEKAIDEMILEVRKIVYKRKLKFFLFLGSSVVASARYCCLFGQSVHFWQRNMLVSGGSICRWVFQTIEKTLF